MSDGWLFGCIMVGTIVGISAPMLGLAAILSSAQCSSQASKMELEHSWGMLQECMVRVDGKWMLLESYKVVKIRPESAR